MTLMVSETAKQIAVHLTLDAAIGSSMFGGGMHSRLVDSISGPANFIPVVLRINRQALFKLRANQAPSSCSAVISEFSCQKSPFPCLPT